jgi:hypothetical protein
MAPRVKMGWIMREVGWSQGATEGWNHIGETTEDIQDQFWGGVPRIQIF